jgi:hypothetical protein
MQLEILISFTPDLVYFMLKSWLTFSDPEYKFKVARTNFFPQPNVSDIYDKFYMCLNDLDSGIYMHLRTDKV